MDGLYKKVSNTFIIKILGLGIAFIFQIILGRVLKPEFYGQYTMFLTYTNILSIIAVLGMDRNLIKDVARITNDKLKNQALLKFSLKISFVLFVILAIFVLLFHSAMDVSLNMVHLLIIMLFIKVVIVIFNGYLQGMGLIVKITFLNVLLNNILKILLFIIFFKTQFNGLYSAIYSFIISETITLILRSLIIKKILGRHISFRTNLSHNEKKQFIEYSITVALIAGMGILLQNIDKIMISKMLDFRSVGIYKVSQNYVSLIGIFITPFIAFWPVISKLYHENKITEIENEMKKIVKIVTYLVVPMFFIFLFLNEKLLLIFGDAYVSDEARKVLMILAFAFLVDAVSGPIGSILTMTKYAKYILINNIISLVLNVVLNFIFIKMYGIVGVAIGTGISVIVNNLISIIEVKLLLGIFSYDYKNVVQIVTFSIGNFLWGSWLIRIININNNYIYIIVFGMMIYIINLLIIFFINKQIIVDVLMRKKEV